MRPRCPTCGAGYRGGPDCGRCGADLRALSAVLLAAHTARESCRRALLSGDGEAAHRQAREAIRLHDTPAARRLLVLARIATGRFREAAALLAREVASD